MENNNELSKCAKLEKELEEFYNNWNYKEIEDKISSEINKRVEEINRFLYNYKITFCIDRENWNYDRRYLSFYIIFDSHNKRTHRDYDYVPIVSWGNAFPYRSYDINDILNNISKELNYELKMKNYTKELTPDYIELILSLKGYFRSILEQLSIYWENSMFIYTDGFRWIKNWYHFWKIIPKEKFT